MSALIEIAIVLLLIVANGVFAMAEIAMVSSRKVRLQAMAEDGVSGAARALEMASNPENLLSTVQIGITLIGIMAGAFGGATLSERLAEHLAAIPLLEPYAKPVSFVSVVAVITYLSLVVGELVPKQLGLRNPEATACLLAGPMYMLSIVTAPAVKLLSISSRVLTSLLPLKPIADQTVTEEEVRILIGQGTETGAILASEGEMVERVFRLGDRKVTAMMTPRTDVIWLELADWQARAQAGGPWDGFGEWRLVTDTGHTHYPVGDGALDRLVGVASVKVLARHIAEGKPFDFRASLLEPLAVPESLTGVRLLERFSATDRRFAIVIDEFGGTSGVISLDDLMDVLLGEMQRPEDGDGERFVRRSDGSWLVAGWVPVHDCNEIFGEEELVPEQGVDYSTLAGFLLDSLGHTPSTGEVLPWKGWEFEVVDMDGLRIDKVLVRRTEAAG